LIPGIFSPSDVSLCLSYGYNLLKLFPANIFPLSYIRDLKGPFPQTEYIAVGGVNEKNYKNFLSAGYVGVGIGSNLFPKKFVLNNDWDSIRKIIVKYKTQY
jgi:2-dehydro-3-deoxyphosphogluconate aldolase/(4S)-4-hydroxy-2-oxoglutarate aldolase